MSNRLSKSRFVQGLQCHKLLWWRAHEPEAAELVPGASLQSVFDRGRRVGEAARGYVPGGVLVDAPFDAYETRIEATRAAIASGAPVIYEASFSEDGVFVAADVLVREGGGWTLVEVKSTTKVKEVHLPDVAVQVHVLRRAGLDVRRAEVMHLNRQCRFPDLSNLFVRVDVTRDLAPWLADVPAAISAQRAALDGELPEVETGAHCMLPYECPFLSRCHAAEPDFAVRTLYKMSPARTHALAASGFPTIDVVPDSVWLNAIQRRQRRAVREGRLVIEGDLAAALGRFDGEVAYLDFETVMLPIPRWNGCRPYETVPVQFSCLRGGWKHEWIARGGGDPREEIARALLAATAGADHVLTWNDSFERSCIASLVDAVPALASSLRELDRKIRDLLPIVREHVYDPRFRGSFGLKRVVAALVPELAYGDLAIADGAVATALLERLIEDGSLEDAERAALERSLLRYCERDTIALAALFDKLREVARGGTVVAATAT